MHGEFKGLKNNVHWQLNNEIENGSVDFVESGNRGRLFLMYSNQMYMFPAYFVEIV